MSYRFRQFEIPERMMPSIIGYVEHGHPVGDFLSAVIDNDLFEACGRADDENLENLPAFVGYFYNEPPSACYGSREKRLAWIAKHQQAATV